MKKPYNDTKYNTYSNKLNFSTLLRNSVLTLFLSWRLMLAFTVRLKLKRANRFILLPMSICLLFPIDATAKISAITINTIQGTAPYIELNGEKITDVGQLLSIKIGDKRYISDAKGNIQQVSEDGTLTPMTAPITLAEAGDSFDSVSTQVPANSMTYALDDNNIIPSSSRKSDDGDAPFTLVGYLKGEWKDKEGNTIGNNLADSVSVSKGPYTLTLTTTGNPSISTPYGDPNTTTYGNGTAVYTINPASGPIIHYAKPNMSYATGQYAGPANMWDTSKGFITQSTYERNFPTTAANGLFFYLDIAGSTEKLTWSTVKTDDKLITATPSEMTATSVKITITGPTTAGTGLNNTDTPSKINVPTLPAKLVLEGKNSSGKVVARYGFVVQKWFISRGRFTGRPPKNIVANQTSWCNGIGYRIARVNELTNASGLTTNGDTISGAAPGSGGNYIKRTIGAGFFTEWGLMGKDSYGTADFQDNGYHTNDRNSNGSMTLTVAPDNNISVTSQPVDTNESFGICVSP